MESLRAFLALWLCSSLCVTPFASAQSAAAARATAAKAGYRSTQLHGDARILHALNRFTFGPRPGDLEAARAMGLEKWFDQQLHPASLDETAFDARLAQFPAMQWGIPTLIYRYPSNAMIRMAMNGRAPIPQNSVLQAIYENQIYRIRARQQNRAIGQRKFQRLSSGAPVMTNSEASGLSVAAPMDQSTSPGADMADPGQMDMMAGDEEQAEPVDASFISDILTLPPQQRVARLVAIREPQFDAFIKALRPPQRAALVAGLSPGQKEIVGALENPEGMVTQELISERLLRDIYSNAQLQQVMADFWLNHFNIYLHKDEQMPYYLVSYERDTIEPYALGKFEDLLEAVAHSPAMMLYLDNASSVGPDSLAAERFKHAAWRRRAHQRQDPPGINENYGRELMELHTVGVNSGYTQADVIQVARILTGWTVDRPQLGGGFIFNPARHEPGTKKVMGVKFKQNGEMEGEQLLHLLATRPATAHFICSELAVRFVSDNPPQALVDRMARAYLASGGNISAVLKTLFDSPEFWSTSDYQNKVKTPIEYVASAVRASNADVEDYMPLANALRVMGMPVYGCIPPNGYDWDSSAWVNTGALVDRMNFAVALAAGRLPGIKVNWTPETEVANLASGPAPDPATEEARLERMLLPGGASISTRSAALSQFEAQNARESAAVRPISAVRRFNGRLAPRQLERQDQLLAGLLIGSPEFQRR